MEISGDVKGPISYFYLTLLFLLPLATFSFLVLLYPSFFLSYLSIFALLSFSSSFFCFFFLGWHPGPVRCECRKIIDKECRPGPHPSPLLSFFCLCSTAHWVSRSLFFSFLPLSLLRSSICLLPLSGWCTAGRACTAA